MKKHVVWLIAMVLILALAVPGHALQASVDRDLNLVIPSLELDGQQYEVYLDLLSPDAEPNEYSWHLTSIVPEPATEAPATLDANLSVTIPNFVFLGVNFRVQLTFNPDPANIPEPSWGLNVELFFEVANSLKNRQQGITVPQPVAASLQEGLNQAAFSIYQSITAMQQLTGRESDFFFSPYSVLQSLAMVYAGARGQTAAQMQDVLHYNLPEAELHAAFNALNQVLAERGEGLQGAIGVLPFFPPGFSLNIANSFWAVRSPLQETLLQRDGIHQEYLDLLALNYGDGLRFLNMMGVTPRDREEVSRQINAWTRHATRQAIQQVIDANQIDNTTSLLLTSAIYYNAAWKHPFSRVRTEYGSFKNLNGQTKSVRMMDQENDFRHYAGSDFDAVDIRYAGEELSMLIILPHDGRFRQVQARLGADLLQQVLTDMGGEKNIRLFMPHWQTSSATDMTGVLRHLGLTDLFTTGVADLSGINGARNLTLGQLTHHAAITVNEEGTKAAAASAARNIGSLDQPLFQMNRPFLYIIRDVPTETILFMGRVINP